MKIVYCTDTVCYPGGIQRITIAKANALADIKGNDVWIVVSDNKRPTPVLTISEKVHLVDLDVNYYEDDWKSKLHVLKGIFVKRREHKCKLRKLLERIQPDIVISTGTSEKYFLPRLRLSSKAAFIREIHFPSDYRQRAANNLFERLSAWAGDFWDYQIYIKEYNGIVVLTKEDKECNWRKDNLVTVIPNPITISHNCLSSLKNKKVITAGRLTMPKNYLSLINVWTIVHQSYPDWKLEIWGEGLQQQELQHQIEKNHLQASAHLMGYTDDIITKFAEASVFLSTSLFEGFPLVFVEAMSCGLPIVSYECPFGPKDIITEGKDGFLVPVGDEQAMAERIIYLIEHVDVRQQMGAAALDKSKQYSMDIIIRRWVILFQQMTNEKKEKYE